MSSFDFTAILKFMSALFEAFMNLFAKLGFDMSGDKNADAGAGA